MQQNALVGIRGPGCVELECPPGVLFHRIRLVPRPGQVVERNGAWRAAADGNDRHRGCHVPCHALANSRSWQRQQDKLCLPVGDEPLELALGILWIEQAGEGSYLGPPEARNAITKSGQLYSTAAMRSPGRRPSLLPVAAARAAGCGHQASSVVANTVFAVDDGDLRRVSPHRFAAETSQGSSRQPPIAAVFVERCATATNSRSQGL